jgi:NitT/TauT family transport system ATP-binding protein
MDAMTSRLSLRGLSKRYPNGFEALTPIDLDIGAGEFVAIVGASGCGKSTLLRMVAGLEPRSGGRVLVEGASISGPGPDRAMVFQDYSLYPWLTVTQNIRFCRELKAHTKSTGMSPGEAMKRANLLIELMGLARVRDSYPSKLSGGMRQRVAIARALMAKPLLLLMDEPFGALDTQTREVMHELILHVKHAERRTILFVTHDVEEAIYLADRVVVLAPNPGRIDCVMDVPFTQRVPDLKLEPEFLQLKRSITERIRTTSGISADLDALRELAGISLQ